MADRKARTLRIVGMEAKAVGGALGEDVDHRDAQSRQFRRRLKINAGRCENDPVDLSVQQGFQMQFCQAFVVVCGAKEKRHAMVHQNLRHAARHRQGQAAIGIIGQHPDRMAPLRQQPTRECVWPESDRLSHAANLFAGLGVRPAGAIQRVGGR